jgi:hypothetical protein
MVKSAVRKELGVLSDGRADGIERLDKKPFDSNSGVPTITTRHQKLGDDCLVAVQYDTKMKLLTYGRGCHPSI